MMQCVATLYDVSTFIDKRKWNSTGYRLLVGVARAEDRFVGTLRELLQPDYLALLGKDFGRLKSIVVNIGIEG